MAPITQLRKHQADALRIANEIVEGTRSQKTVVASVTPGGGKTLMASLFAQTLIKGDVADHVLIVCPRETLVAQMVGGFRVPELDLPLGVRAASDGVVAQRSLLRHERAGVVTTYQAIVAAPKKYERLVSKDRWILVIDEGHHLSMTEHPNWEKALAPLAAQATFVLIMSGTMTRDDRAPIAFVPYDSDKKPIVDVRYTRRDALEEQAILNVSVKLCDGQARYWDKLQTHAVTVSAATVKQEPKALRTILQDPAYRDTLLGDALKEWEGFRVDCYKSRALVVCETQQAARVVSRYIKDHTRWEPSLVISDEGTGARRALRRFRDKGEGDILVTCQVAYEGLDVPDLTHLICLTNIRSRPWLEQCFARVTRFDRNSHLSWEQQRAFLYVPNDPSMVTFLSEWLEEQDGAFDEQRIRNGLVQLKPRRSTFSPIDASLGEIRYADTDGVVFSDADNRRVQRFKHDYPTFASHAASEILSLARQLWPNDADFDSESAAE